MIQFENITWRNFLSYGNNLTSINLLNNNNNITLIIGENGSGKSILVDGISYSLFGKAYRKVNLADLINWDNGKNMEVSINFTKGKDKYKIIRGQKPNIFKIFKNDFNEGKELKFSNMDDQQNELEKNILGFDRKIFNQISLMSSRYYTSFLELTGPNQRVIIKELFDLNILIKINEITKEKIIKINEAKNKLENDKKNKEEKINLIEKELEEAKKFNGDIINNKELKKEKIKKEILNFNSEIEKLNEYINKWNPDINEQLIKNETLFFENNNEITKSEILKNHVWVEIKNKYQKDIDINNESVSKFEKERITLESEFDKSIALLNMSRDGEDLNKINKSLEFYNNNTICEICQSELKGEKIDKIKLEIQTSYNNLSENIKDKQIKIIKITDDYANTLKKIISKEKNLKEKKRNMNALIQKETDENIKSVSGKIDNLKNLNKILEKEINEQKERLNKYNEVKITNEKIKENIKSKEEELNEIDNIKLLDEKRLLDLISNEKIESNKINGEISKFNLSLSYLNIIIDMTSDSGIRRIVINKYLNLLNSKMKETLNLFEAGYNIEFNDEMDPKLYVRGKEINYESLSGGQRQRIDLAILFAFILFTRIKLIASTNILIFDEILDSSLDESGIDILISIFEKIAIENGYSIFVISHRDSNYNRFENVLKIEMNNNFSEIKKLID